MTDTRTAVKIVPINMNEGEDPVNSESHISYNEPVFKTKSVIYSQPLDMEFPVVVNYKEETETVVPLPMKDSNQLRKQSSSLAVPLDKENWKFKGVPELELEWKDLVMQTKVNKKDKEPPKIILNHINGRVRSGEALAIIGSSGAGKTTLLNLISRKIESKNLTFSGQLLLNGHEIDINKFNSVVAYVMQDDILEAVMTPLEILLFTAKLKLDLPEEEIEKRVLQMLNDLNLYKCKDTKVGSTLIRGVSGGERKRTSIGVELISDPRIIFLDEPTTGLDSYNAYEVVILLRQLAASGRMVIFTIHQPASEIFQLLDKLCILALGKTVYFGPSMMSYDQFEILGLPCPPKYNPFEHYMELTTQASVNNPNVLKVYPELEAIEHIQTRYNRYTTILSESFEKNKPNYLENYEPITEFSEDTQKMFKSKDITKGFAVEFGYLYFKHTIIALRAPKLFFVKIFQNLLTAVIIGVLFQNVKNKIFKI